MFAAVLFTISLVVLQCTQTGAQSLGTHGVREIDGERKPWSWKPNDKPLPIKNLQGKTFA